MNEDTIKVTQLPSAETITQNDLLMIVQNNENKKATSSQMVDLLSDEFANYYDIDETDALLDEKADITDVPTKTSDLTNDSEFIDKDVNNLTNYTKTSDLSAVATSGSYTDLSNTPTIPDMSETYGTSTTDGYSEAYLNNKLVNVGTSVDSNYRTNIISSKNLFDKSTMILKAYINATTGELANGNDFRTIYIPCKANTTYTIKKIISNRFTWGFTTDNDVNTPKILIDTNGDSSLTEKTITSPNNSKYMFVMISKITDDISQLQDILDSIMINEGSTALDYEPFIKKTINVNNNKFSDTINVGTEIDSANRVNVLYSHNIFNPSNVQTSNGITSTLNEDGSISYSGTASSTYCDLTSVIDCNIPAGTTLTFSINEALSYRAVIYFDTSNTDRMIIDTGSKSITLTTTIAHTKMKLNIDRLTQNTQYSGKIYPMLNYGNEAMPFEKYLTPSINVDGEEIYNSNIMNYSTNEQVIGKWIDGKPLYRRTITAQNLPTNTNNTISVENGSNLNVYNIYGVVIGGGTDYICNINSLFGTDTTNNNVWCMFRSGEIRSYCGTYLTSNFKYDAHITLEYTKTTD